MIDNLFGNVSEICESHVVLDTNSGVGYEISMSKNSIVDITLNESIKILVHHTVKEQAEDLYGFVDQYDRAFFRQLISLNGVGEKKALNIMSEHSAQAVKKAFVDEDLVFLSKLPGIGKKTAEKMAIALRGKITYTDVNITDNNERSRVEKVKGSVIKALTNMGYAKDKATSLADETARPEDSVDTLIKKCLLVSCE